MLHTVVKLSKYLRHPTNAKYRTIVEKALFRKKKVLGNEGTILFTLIDRPGLSLTEIYDRDFRGGPILALAPSGHSLRLPGMVRKKAAQKGFWSRVWLYTETKSHIPGDEGEWTMPTSKNWEPSCWIRVREMKELPPWIIEKIKIPLYSPLNSRTLTKYLSPLESHHPTNKLLNEMWASGTGDQFIKIFSIGEDEFDSQKAWEAFCKWVMGFKKEHLTGWDILQRCPDDESFHVNVSGWPLKYVNPHYLQWLVCDGRIPRTERFPGFYKPSKDPKTWQLLAPILPERTFTPYDPLKSKIEAFLKKKENEEIFRPPYATSNKGAWDEETDFNRPWREDYTTGKWRGRQDRVIPEDRQASGLTWDQYKAYLKDKRNALPPPQGTHVERFESLGTNKWHKWLWQGRTPFSGKDGEEPEEYELTENLGYDTIRTMAHSGEWTPAPRDAVLTDWIPKAAPESEEDIYDQLMTIRERVTSRIRYFEKLTSMKGPLSRKDKDLLVWEVEEVLVQIDMWRADICARLWPTMQSLGMTDTRLIEETDNLIDELESELRGDRILLEVEEETPREESEGVVSGENTSRSSKRTQQALRESLQGSLSRDPELARSLGLETVIHR